jgi:hypothetical protein
MYKVEIRVPDNVLVQLTREQFELFRDNGIAGMLHLLGFHGPCSARAFSDYSHCDKVVEINTDEVVKPSLFGHALPYTAEVI